MSRKPARRLLRVVAAAGCVVLIALAAGLIVSLDTADYRIVVQAQINQDGRGLARHHLRFGFVDNVHQHHHQHHQHDYTVIETRECAGGSYTTTQYGYGYDPASGGFTHSAPTTVFHSVDPSVEYASIFVPANNTGSGPGTSCRLETERLYFSVEPR